MVGVNGIFSPGASVGDGFSFVIWFHRRIVNAIGFSPQCNTIFAKHFLHHLHGHFLHGSTAQCPCCAVDIYVLSPTMGIFLIEIGARNVFSLPPQYSLPLGFCFSVPTARYRFVGWQGKRNGQVCFFRDFLPWFEASFGNSQKRSIPVRVSMGTRQ